jgi:hypothetical protein
MNFDNLYQGVNPDFVIWYGQAYQALLQLTIENIENNSSVFHSSVCGEHHRFSGRKKLTGASTLVQPPLEIFQGKGLIED